MKKYSNEKGVTLIELLVTLVVSSIISVAVFSVMINVLNYNQKLNSETLLRSEADYIMAMFINDIYSAQDITIIEDEKMLQVQTNNERFFLLGFNEEGILGKSPLFDNPSSKPTQFIPLHDEKYSFQNNEVSSTIAINGNLIEISMWLFDKSNESARPVQLESKISFIGNGGVDQR